MVFACVFLTLNALAQKINFNAVSTTNSHVRILESGKVKVHSYVNPQLIQVTSYIIELKDSLVLIDAQLTYTFTKEVLEYAQQLNKPIARVILTHAHPDHFLGAYAFKEFPVYALKETKDAIAANGSGARDVFVKNFGEKDAAPEVLIPSKLLPEGLTKINGINFVVKKIIDSEADVLALIEIPKARILIAGDFIYNNVHLFPGNNQFQNWKKQLEQLSPSLNGKIILPGHGYPADASILKENIDYLSKAIEVAAKPGMDTEGYKKEMVNSFPNHGAAILIDFGAYALFQK